MNSVKIHLALNHLPVFCLLFALALSFWAWYRKEENWFNLALVLSGLAGVCSLLVTFSGEAAHDLLKATGNVEHLFVHNHEEAAEQANIATILVALAAVGCYFLSHWEKWRKHGRILYSAALILAIALLVRAAHLGGQIHHPELRSEPTTQKSK